MYLSNHHHCKIKYFGKIIKENATCWLKTTSDVTSNENSSTLAEIYQPVFPFFTTWLLTKLSVVPDWTTLEWSTVMDPAFHVSDDSSKGLTGLSCPRQDQAANPVSDADKPNQSLLHFLTGWHPLLSLKFKVEAKSSKDSSRRGNAANSEGHFYDKRSSKALVVAQWLSIHLVILFNWVWIPQGARIFLIFKLS